MEAEREKDKLTVLIVEDEKPVRETTKTMLEMAGYSVITAQDGIEAIDLYDADRERINLILLDLSMPRMSGKETLSQLLERNSEVKVIVASGYDVDGPVGELIDMGAKSAIQKPYRMVQLLESVQKALQ